MAQRALSRPPARHLSVACRHFASVNNLGFVIIASPPVPRKAFRLAMVTTFGRPSELTASKSINRFSNTCLESVSPGSCFLCRVFDYRNMFLLEDVSTFTPPNGGDDFIRWWRALDSHFLRFLETGRTSALSRY